MMRKVGGNASNNNNRKSNLNGRSFQADMSCTTIGSPKHKSTGSSHYNGSSNRRPAS